ncbi:VOC family protein [Agrobacterium sp. NPDC090273]|uniref:VOC family protein n=1 Tax=Agrobacterium sp. NPDC090273 TaxID=3363919 RepID=UPI00383BAC94
MSFITAILVHVADVEEGLTWYARAFPEALPSVSHPSGFEFLQVGDVQLEIVPADEKVASGAAGSVVYWWTDDFEGAMAHWRDIGGVLYRGPMRIDGDLWMCQFRDPWGNCVGLRGPMVKTLS